MIACHDLTFTPAGAGEPILAGVGLAIGKGERVGIVGPSGAGKSTLGYHLCGAHALALAGTTTGGLTLAGRACLAGGPPGFAGLVGQNPEAQLFCATLGEEISLGLRARGAGEAACREACRDLLGRYGLSGREEAALTKLSLGQKQLIAILSMLAIRPKVLLLDEPTSYLDAATADRLFDHLDALCRDRGLVVLVIEHDLTRLSGFADRLLALEGGRLVFDGPTAAFPPRKRLAPLPEIPPPDGRVPPSLDFGGASFGYGPGEATVADIDLAVRPGEIVALTGPNGSGKSTLLRLAKGLAKPRSGRVSLGAGLSFERDVGLMFQNPEEQIFAHTVAAECGYWLANLDTPAALGEERVAGILAALGLGDRLTRSPFSLSFGEKRRLCLAAVLVARPAVLCLDEPTTGLDDANLVVMAAVLRRRAASGAAVLVATHEASFTALAATRVVRLEAGRIVSDRPNREPRHAA